MAWKKYYKTILTIQFLSERRLKDEKMIGETIDKALDNCKDWAMDFSCKQISAAKAIEIGKALAKNSLHEESKLKVLPHK
mgnify:CR=1 FL=1